MIEKLEFFENLIYVPSFFRLCDKFLVYFIIMSLFENDENFDEILKKAKLIDKGIQCLEKKLSNVKSLGVSFAPDETRNAALEVLKEYDEEVAAMKVGI